MKEELKKAAEQGLALMDENAALQLQVNNIQKEKDMLQSQLEQFELAQVELAKVRFLQLLLKMPNASHVGR